ncbi:MAG: DNA primase [Lentisphaeria bacterium]|nr:DNA primase [Candidatus Neomarinimicrobiota bacterium]MCF7842593.1 DNA primase [Lentisphaeria bacterium]
MARIPEHQIEQVREANDIVDVVGDYVRLKKSGRNYFGLCPFHGEKTPSFSVAPDKQIFHCFGCGVGGNVINFIMQYEKIEFVEAVKLLADRAGITLQYESGGSGAPAPKKEDLSHYHSLHERITGLYEKALWQSNEGKQALDYLRGRGLVDAVLKRFRVGYAPDQWDFVTLQVMKLGLPKEVLTKSGLLMTKDRGGFYDRFRKRIMFPIMGVQGRVIAFGGRVLPGDDQSAKYMNSPETPVYHKGKVLYGLNHTKGDIRNAQEAILVEGYLDLIRLYQSGFHNVAAGSGTALTEQHGKILSRFADTVFLCYDSDEAGVKATDRAGKILLDAGLTVRVIQLPSGSDPDSYFDDHSPEDFQALLDEAPDFMGYLVSYYRPRLRSATAKSNFAERFVSDLAQMNNRLTRELLLSQFAEGMGMTESTLFRLLRDKIRYQPHRRGEENGTRDSLRPESATDKAEYELLRLHFSESEVVLKWLLKNLEPEILERMRFKEIFQKARSELENELPLNRSRMVDALRDSPLQSLVSRILFDLDSGKAVTVQLAQDCVSALKQHQLKEELKTLREELRDVEKNDGDVLTILRQIRTIEKQLTAEKQTG